MQGFKRSLKIFQCLFCQTISVLFKRLGRLHSQGRIQDLSGGGGVLDFFLGAKKSRFRNKKRAVGEFFLKIDIFPVLQ